MGKALALGIRMAGRIPYDRAVTDAQIKGVPVMSFTDGPVAKEIRKTWDTFLKKLNR